MKIPDLSIAGAGPAALLLAASCAERGLEVTVIGSLLQVQMDGKLCRLVG